MFCKYNFIICSIFYINISSRIIRSNRCMLIICK